jgi:hypothetical protein
MKSTGSVQGTFIAYHDIKQKRYFPVISLYSMPIRLLKNDLWETVPIIKKLQQAMTFGQSYAIRFRGIVWLR